MLELKSTTRRLLGAALLAQMALAANAFASSAHAEVAPEPVTVVPDFIDFGLVEAAETVEHTIWIINTGDEPVNVTAVKGNCGCTTIKDFEPFALDPNEAGDVTIAMRASIIEDRRSNKRVTVTFEEQPAMMIDVTIKSVHAHRAAVAKLEEARMRGRNEDAMPLFASEARIWFGAQTGEGSKLDPFGKGPWADWDQIMKSTSESSRYELIDGGITMVVSEMNEFHRLLERGPSAMRVTYFFNDDNQITGKLVEPLDRDDDHVDRYDEFVAWVKQHHARDAVTMFDGDGSAINPERASARLWLKHLLDWSQDTHAGA